MKPAKANISNSDENLDDSRQGEPSPQRRCERISNLCTKLGQYWLKNVQTCPRTITFTGDCTPPNYQTNLVKNTKYNPFTFLPLVLYNQFKFFFNMFFLFTALSQLVEYLRVGLFITYIGPLIMVLSLTMAKEAYDDYRTYLRDIEANSKVYTVIEENGNREVKSKDLRVGDVVVINAGDRIPADMLTLYSDDQQGSLFIKTDQLDGQTDWKLRKAIKITQNLVKIKVEEEKMTESRKTLWKENSLTAYHELVSDKFSCDVKQPIGQIYTFEGLFKQATEEGNKRQKLTLENTMWTSTVLTNGQVVGLVIYAGRETRIALGASTPRTKVGILDFEVNFLSKLLFFLMVILSLMIILLQKTEPQYILIQFVRLVILLSTIIPISMRVNLDFAKLFYAYQINNDNYIKGTITRNSNFPEELGRVKYILSDKTGTLTQNQMIFKRISIQDTIKFTDQNEIQIKSMIQEYEEEEVKPRIQAKQRFLWEIVMALAICHNVTPVYNEVEQKSEVFEEGSETSQKVKDFQASSPDEITFVKTVQRLGIELVSRSQTQLVLRMPSKELIKFDILYTFPFSSETKRMGIIVRSRKTKQIVFYLKGADSIMKNFINSPQKKGFIDEECKDLSMTGLRTLVFSRKVIKEDVYENWSKRYEQIYNQLDIDKKEIEKLMHQLESGVQFLGVTGIQDKLQRKLKSTIQSLKSANIKIWMITGDKIETAECISRSCGLQKIIEQNVKIEEVTSGIQWKQRWQAVKQNLSRVLIIDGKTLIFVLEGDKERREDFFKTAMKMPAVICCRCSPQQKRTITAGVKEFKKSKEAVLGIGDGGNDVGMIQEADIGVGIVGKQGKQAALAADFSILQFKSLKCLLLWHGRLSYKRSALLASFIIHRGFVVSVIQVIFSCVFYFVSIPVFNSYLQLGYATFFTFWPVFSLILDTDIDKKSALKYPNLYHSLQSSKLLQALNFWSWIWKASIQGSIIMVLSIIFFQDQTYLLVETIGFTTLIILEYLMTFSEIYHLHILMIVCVVGSLLCYAACLMFLNDFVQLASLSLENFIYILLITGISWIPLVLWKLLRKKFYPNDYQIVMKTVKRSLINKQLPKKSGTSSKEDQELRESLL